MPLSKSVTSRSSRVTFELPSGEQPTSGGHNPLSRRRGQSSSSTHGGSGGNGGLGERDYQAEMIHNHSGGPSAYAGPGSVDRSFIASGSPSPASVGIFGRASSMPTPTPITSPNTSTTGRGMPFPSLPTGQFDQQQSSSSLVATSVPTFGEVNFSFGQAAASSSSLKPPMSTPRGPSTTSSGGPADAAISTAAPRPRSAGVMGRFSASSAFQAMANFVGAVKSEESTRAMAAQGAKVSAAATTTEKASSTRNDISSWSLSTNKMDLLRATERGGHPHLFDGDGKLTTGKEVCRFGHVHSVGRPHLGVQGDEASLRGRGSHRHGMSQEWLQRTVHVTGAPPGEHEEIVDTLTRLCGQVAHHRTLRFRVAHTNRSSIMATAADSWESAIPTRSTPDIPTPLRITFSKAASAEKAIELDLGGAGVITTSTGRRIAIVAGDDVSSSTTAGSHPTVGSQHMFLQDEEDQYYGEAPNSSAALVVSMNHSGANNNNTSSGNRHHMLSTSFAPRGGRRVEVSSALGLSVASGSRSVTTPTPQEGPGDLNTIFMQERRTLEEQSKKRVAGAKSGRVDTNAGGLAAVVGMRRVKYPSLMALPFAEYWLLPLISE